MKLKMTDKQILCKCDPDKYDIIKKALELGLVEYDSIIGKDEHELTLLSEYLETLIHKGNND